MKVGDLVKYITRPSSNCALVDLEGMVCESKMNTPQMPPIASKSLPHSSVKEGVLSHIWRVVYQIYENPL